MDARNNIAQDLFYKIRSRFSGLKLGAETGELTINPEEARFFDFDYMEGENPIGHVSISLAEPNSMKVYFSHGITEGMDAGQKNNWYGFLKELRHFAKRRLLSFDTRDIAKDNLDKRDYMFLSQNAQPKQTQPNTIQKPVGESIMSESQMYGSRTMSYQKLMDTRLIIKHNQAVMDDAAPGARSRHISALFVENQEGERFKYPFIHLAGARAMQRHVANGGLPYDEIGKSIIGMSEQIAQLKSFSNYVVRNDLMNSDNNGIVERSTQALNSLREQIKALAKQGHYEAYKENFQVQQPLEVPQEVVEDYTEKFTVKNFKEDIKSVFPVLYRLMQENNTVGYDDIVAMTQNDTQIEESERDQDEKDPFDQFESWVMALGEESGITSDDIDQMNAALSELQELVSQEFPAGVDGNNAIQSLKGIIEDPELYREIKEQAKQDPDTDVRELIYSWMGENAPQAAQRLDFGDFEPMPQDPMAYANASADADAIAYGQREGIEEASGYAYDFDTDYTSESSVAAFNVGTDGKPVITKIMLGKTDITKVVSDEDKAEMAANIDLSDYAEGEETVSYDNYLELNLHIEYNIFGEHRAATWNDPAEYPEIDGYSVHIVGQDGSMVEIDERDLGPKGGEWIEEKIWDDANTRRDDYDHYESEEKDQPTQGNQKMSTQKLAEFIHSFYDKESGTFPKGPEGVCTMVGKKFGEQAEQIARKFVERMAPQQVDASINELSRIRELAGQQGSVDEETAEDDSSTTATLDAVFNEHDFYRLEHIWPALEAGDKKEALRQINHYLNRGKNRAWWGDLQALDIKIDPNNVENSQVVWSKPIQQSAEEDVARKFVERMAPQQTTEQNPELAELARVKELAGLKAEDTDVNELDYKSFTSGDELAELRDAIDKNVLVSVAFVKKDGSVKHMGIKKNISSYVPSTREKTDKQLNVEQNNDIKKVVDINAYIRALKELKASGMEEDQAKAEAAKKAWRSINLKNVLGFMVRGKFFDLRDENEIQQRFGDEIYNSVTPAMKSALAQSQQATESFDFGDSEVDEARGADNFTGDDIHELEKMDDLDQIKSRALELIMTPSKRPMKPEKVSYFKEKIGMMKSKMDIVKLMYDLLLSGEGFGVVGSRNSMGSNTYRQRFKDSIENEAADELARIKDLSGL